MAPEFDSNVLKHKKTGSNNLTKLNDKAPTAIKRIASVYSEVHVRMASADNLNSLILDSDSLELRTYQCIVSAHLLRNTQDLFCQNSLRIISQCVFNSSTLSQKAVDCVHFLIQTNLIHY